MAVSSKRTAVKRDTKRNIISAGKESPYLLGLSHVVRSLDDDLTPVLLGLGK